MPIRFLAALAAIGLVAAGHGTAAAVQDPPRGGYVLEHDAEVARTEPGTHRGGGETVGYSFFESTPNLKLVFRKRALKPGSAIGYHLKRHDEIYYVLSGRGEMTVDGQAFEVGPGAAILTRTGSSHGLKQIGDEDLVILINYEQEALASGAVAAGQNAAAATDRGARLDRFLQSYVDENRVAGLVALVLQDGQPIYEKAIGWRDKEAGDPMRTDTIFRIASQTKALTSAAIMMLVEEGRIRLADPVSRFIPEFAKTTVAERTDDGVRIVPARRQILMRDLLTHTSGISYGTDQHIAKLYEEKGLGPAAGLGWYFADKTEPVCASIERLATLPFVSHPGEAYVYGYNTDVLGCVVERASGLSLDEFLRTRLFEPLGMTDTHFYLPADKRGRLAVVYGSAQDGTSTRAAEGPRGQGHYVDGPRTSFSGGAGLVSTARDYARFLEMIRRGGVHNGQRLLATRSTGLMTTNQVGDIRPTGGLGYGFGFETTDRFGANELDPVGAFGWGGAYGSIYRVDPESRIVMVLMFQLMPNSTDLRQKFATLVYQAFAN